MSKYRIYALILGDVLIEGSVFGCEVKKMDYSEQAKRNFSPIQSIFTDYNDTNYKSYSTYLPYVDPLKIKSEYVISYDSEEDDPKGALGEAITSIDKVCRYLTISYLEDVKNHFGEKRASLQAYIYQVVKIYSLKDKGEEVDIEFKLENEFTYLPKRPELDNWRHENTPDFLNAIFNFHDDTLERALKYLYRSLIGRMILDSPEKIALDHFKSIEIIVNQFSDKGNNSNINQYAKEIETKLGISEADSVQVANLLLNETRFKKKLELAKSKLNLTDEEVKRIQTLWGERSSFGDIAHPSKFDHVERYPNQFPIPSNVQYSGWSDSIAGKLCLKYFEYIRTVFIIDIDQPYSDDTENYLAIVNSQWESNHYAYFSKETNKVKLKKEIVSIIAKELEITESDVIEYKLMSGNNKYNALVRIRPSKQ